MDWLAAILALLLAATHLISRRLHFLDTVERSKWLSFAGGVAVAYVMAKLLPGLAEAQAALHDNGGAVVRFLGNHIYLTALFGLTIFYGLERAAKISRRLNREVSGRDTASDAIFRLHMVSYSLNNVIIAHLLVQRQDKGTLSLLFYAVAMALYFVRNDYGLRHDHKENYDHTSRWVLSGAVLVGYALGVLVTVPPLVISLLFAFLAGGVMLNTLKEELPEEKESRFDAFLTGVVFYALLIVLAQ